MNRKMARILAATALAAGGVVATPIVGGAMADPVPERCPGDTWCIYEHTDYGGQWLPAPYHGPLDYRDWDKVSSAKNNTNHTVCLYSYRPDGSGEADLVHLMGPGEGYLSANYGNDEVDAVHVLMDEPDASACPQTYVEPWH